MYILSINISHHASSCLIDQSGEILYYIEEEILSGAKNFAYDFVEDGNYKFYAVDKVKEYTNEIDYLVFTSFDRINKLDNDIIDFIQSQLLESGIRIKNKPIYEVGKHHYYHACNAFYGSTFEESICIVLDGGGSQSLESNSLIEKYRYPFREVESIYHCSYTKGIVPLYQHYSYLDRFSEEYQNRSDELFFIQESPYKKVFSDTLSCGDLFNLICDIMKFGGHEAGKLMGLASYGKFLDPSEWFIQKDDEWITRDRFLDFLYSNYNLNEDNVQELLKKEKPLEGFNPRINHEGYEILANLAYKLQEQTFNHTLRIIEKAYSLSSSNNIVVSGGYFLNCVNNYRYLPHIKGQFYVDPISHDGGTSIGAAKDTLLKNSRKKNISFKDAFTLSNIYLG
jgi:carbamoyltransferase